MPIFRKRNLRRHTVRFLYRQVENQSLPPETRQAIAKLLEKEALVDRVNDFAFKLLVKSKKDVLFEGLPNDAVGGELLDKLFQFLNDHWAEILALILKLLGI